MRLSTVLLGALAMGQVSRWRRDQVAARLGERKDELRAWGLQDRPETRRLLVAIAELEWVLEVLKSSPVAESVEEEKG